MSENDYDVTLAELTDRSVGRLANAEVFDVAAFEALKAHLWRKAAGLCEQRFVMRHLSQASPCYCSRGN